MKYSQLNRKLLNRLNRTVHRAEQRIEPVQDASEEII